jgi:two-component system cell cycle response regulator
MSASCILVVDDKPTNLKLVCDLLASEGYEILKAMDAEEALHILAFRLPDLLLLDIGLPGMDGLALARQLRAEERTRHLRIIALTAFAMNGDEAKALAAGCDGYITKPIDTRALAATVAAQLPQAAPASKSAGLKILIVEDTPSDFKLARLVLESSGHQVDGRDAAEKALQAVKEDRPQIVLLDLMLPGMDGLAFARMLKADPDTRDIQVVAVTCFPERFTKAAALAAGCDAYLTKPINTAGLSRQLESVLEARAGAQQKEAS